MGSRVVLHLTKDLYNKRLEAALKEREYYWKFKLILSNFKSKESIFWPIFVEEQPKIHKIGCFGSEQTIKI